jgi:hypothetical protein
MRTDLGRLDAIAQILQIGSFLRGMIPKSMPSGHDPMGGDRFSEKIMPKQNIGSDPAKLDQTLARRLGVTVRAVIDCRESAGSIPGSVR